VRLPNGEDAIVIENRPLHRLGYTRIVGAPKDGYTQQVTTFESGLGTGSPEQRIREQDQDGVDAEVMFAHGTHLSLWRGIKEDEGFRALVHAYNEYLAEDYCAYDRERLLAMAVIPPTNLEDAVAELEYSARAGLKGVALYRFPSGKGYPTREDDRFWAAALDLRMPITAHTNGGSTRFANEGPVFPYPRRPVDRGEDRDPITLLFRFCGDTAFAAIQLAYAGVFDRFPQLKIFWAETQIGWLPFALWQLDDSHERYMPLNRELWGMESLERRPSDYLREQNLWGFMTDPVGVRLRDEAGVQALMWGSDFAHAASDWPHSRERIQEAFAGVPDDERYRMLAGNAIEFFHLNAH
jgi:predicted TIM-barrel fold metal-dependent hydrolase